MANRKQTLKLIVHCSATRKGQDIGAAEIRHWHTAPKPEGRGWSDIGYHDVIKRDGSREPGSDVMAIGAHARGYNSVSIGVCLVGGVDDQGKPCFNFTSAQMDTLKQVVIGYQVQFPGIEVLGHCDLPDVTKLCPCFDVRAWFDKGHG